MPRKHFIWDPVTSAYLMEQDGHGDTTAVYHTEPVPYGRLISQRRDNQTFYHHYDALGSTRQLTDESQDVTDEYAYSAYGETVAQSGTTDNPFRWLGAVGYYFDAETGGYYVRTRNYLPANGRWMSNDPLLFVDGVNLYTDYFAPNGVDPTGTTGWLISPPVGTGWDNPEMHFGSPPNPIQLIIEESNRRRGSRGPGDDCSHHCFANCLAAHLSLGVGGPVAAAGSSVFELIYPSSDWRQDIIANWQGGIGGVISPVVTGLGLLWSPQEFCDWLCGTHKVR